MSDNSSTAQAAGYSGWLAADEAALHYIATHRSAECLRIKSSFGNLTP